MLAQAPELAGKKLEVWAYDIERLAGNEDLGRTSWPRGEVAAVDAAAGEVLLESLVNPEIPVPEGAFGNRRVRGFLRA